tara:strand:- start:805 stop:2208 length:1404 start_codon:yes stop_codon:yes gene_type:complete
MKQILFILLSLSIALGTTNSCKKKKVLSNSIYNINISEDTILFDTIFTTIGSTTKYFKCYNPHNGKINISNITLEKGTDSPYRINVDGESGVNFSNIEILSGDSIFIFVEVTIDPDLDNSLVVEDKIKFVTNGNETQVVLNAWGQDAYFYVNEVVSGVWSNDKPHVIYGLAAVGYPGIDSNLSLTIEPGTMIHGHANATLYVYKSSLIVNGEVNNPVTFQQDRMEDYLLYPADSVAGQWRGIYFSAPKNSNITHAEIKNAVIGIQIDTLSDNENVILDKVRINNSLYANLLTQGANVTASNCLFGNSNNYSAFISIGGNISFEHCTFANYWYGSRNTPAFVLKDYYESVNNQVILRPFESAVFNNCIMHGSTDTEFICDTLGATFGLSGNTSFNYCAIKSEYALSDINLFNNCYLNLEPDFVSTSSWNYDLGPQSNVVDLGGSSSISQDILERPRLAPNDLGCYEKQ